jgi:peptidoglycan/LPS O-acetylase OafA/YrhL
VTTSRLEYRPALDGVRALAVAMVVLFHAGVPGFTGGYVGVSVFFTLSGFLITSLLLLEHQHSGRVDLGAFWARRARRLLPASAACLAGVVVAARLGAFEGVEHLRRDVVGSALQVQNWVLLGSGESYTDLLAEAGGKASPLEHYWSLAIEEQFYWVWPLAFVAIVAARHRRVLVMALLTVTASIAAPVIAIVWGPDAAYWATPARLAEILLGALAAMLLSGRVLPAGARFLAPVGLAGLCLLVVWLPAGRGPAYEGGLPLIALLSVFLVIGLEVPGALRTVLGAAPLVLVGRVSYGLYLYHWPVFVILDPPRTGLDGPALLALRLAVTAGVTALSYVALERPVRSLRWSPRRTAAVAITATASVVVLALGAISAAPAPYWRVTEIASTPITSAPPRLPENARESGSLHQVADIGAETAAARAVIGPASSDADVPIGGDAAPARAPTEPARILVVGDSTAEATGGGLLRWAHERPEIAEVRLVVSPGCGFVRGGVVVGDEATDVPFASVCDENLDVHLPNALREWRPHVVMLMSTLRDTDLRRWDAAVLGPLDRDFQRRLRADYRAITEQVVSAGAIAAWIRPPTGDPFWSGDPGRFGDTPERRSIDEFLHALAFVPDDRVVLVDLRSWSEVDGIALDHDARPDGLHWTPDAATDVSRRWLGPALVSAATEPA